MASMGEDTDWIFDFILSIIDSPEWDISVMGFIDEKCVIFDNEEENKFSYTDCHNEFKELVELLIASSLSEVGAGIDDLVKAMESSRFSRDVNTAAYEQMIALEDFLTFKKLMVKRNMELELEAVRALQATGAPITAPVDDEEAETDFERSLKQADDALLAESKDDSFDDDPEAKLEGAELDKCLREAMDQNLMELELLHKREEMEQLELEQALALSLALEEERIAAVALEDELDEEMKLALHAAKEREVKAKAAVKAQKQALKELDEYSRSSDTKEENAEGDVRKKAAQEAQREAEIAERLRRETEEKARKQLLQRRKESKAEEKRENERSKNSQSEAKEGKRSSMSKLAPVKRGSGSNAPLNGTPACLGDLQEQMEERRLQAETAFKKNQAMLAEQRKAQRELQAQADVTAEEMQERAAHLKLMRDKIVAKKKADREAQAAKVNKAKEEDEGRRGVDDDSNTAAKKAAATAKAKAAAEAKDGQETSKGKGDDTLAEEKRKAMRVALARRMKQDLLESEDHRLEEVQETHLAALDEKLRSVEKLREENRLKEEKLAEEIKKQQYRRAKNISRSARKSRAAVDDYSFGESS